MLPEDLQPYLKRLEIIRLTALQIQKDFEMSGFEIKFSGHEETAYDELYNQILPVIEKLIKTDFEKLLQLMYRIDLSEAKVKAFYSDKDQPYHEIITQLIIQRQLQKVVTRLAYQKLNNNAKGSDQINQ